MGHASSKEVRHEPQNPRRLSKPQTNSSSFNISQPKIGKCSKATDPGQNTVLDESMFWKSPWTGDLLPKVTPETDLTDRNRVRSFPSFSALQPESPLLAQGSKRWSSIDDFALMKHDNSLSRSSSYISRRLSRKSLNNTQRPGSQPQPKKMALRETRREPVIHFGPSDIGNHDHHSRIENLTTEEWSPVEDSCVPLSRRQSFRRPGIATRTPSWGLYRTQLSSIQQEDEKEHLSATPSALQPPREPLYEPEDQEEYTPALSSDRRATSPVALDYSHLIGFKRGTLRIVNGSASPASSDRIGLLTASSLADEAPKSVHAKENSGLFTSNANHHDETIDVLDNSFYYENNTSDSGQSRVSCEGLVSEPIEFTRIEKTTSITNVDSGYSSLSSVRSDNSSGQSSSPPMDSPLCSSPTKSEGCSHNGEYFYNQTNERCETNNTSLDRHDDNLGPHLAGYSMAERPRYYANLGHLSIPPVPEHISIDDKESDSDGSYSETEGDDSVNNGQSSPIHSKSAMSPIPNSLWESQSQLEYVNQAVVTTSYKTQKPFQMGGSLAYREQTFDVPRGRARSRSIGHARSKLVKTRKVPALGKGYHF